MTDPEDIIKEWIYKELEQQGLEGTADEYDKVVGELPEMVTPKIIREIVAQLFPKGKRGCSPRVSSLKHPRQFPDFSRELTSRRSRVT